MTRAPLFVLVLGGVLMLGCSAEPPSAPAGQPAADSAATDPAAQTTPIFADDFEQGKSESWVETEPPAVATETAPPAE